MTEPNSRQSIDELLKWLKDRGVETNRREIYDLLNAKQIPEPRVDAKGYHDWTKSAGAVLAYFQRRERLQAAANAQRTRPRLR